MTPQKSSKYMFGCGLALALCTSWGSAHAASQEQVLHSFKGGRDGEYPSANLIADSAGNLYGTTYEGGAKNNGAVFEVTPEGKETVLYSFCSAANCTDGKTPVAGLIADSAGNLYATTEDGGAKNGGTVFKVTPEGNETVLYSFCSAANCTDGKTPVAGLIADSAGDLYGTTRDGGAENDGTVFKVTPEGNEMVLYSFCSLAYCTDGENPAAGLIADSAGNLYGTTYYGGQSSYCGCGTVFKVTPGGTETVLYSFCSVANCTDGAYPNASLIADSAGNLYGMTGNGGGSEYVRAYGIVFKITTK